MTIPTPFGKVQFPVPEIPSFEVKIDARRSKALAHAIGGDIGSFIPILGDVIEDIHGAELRRNLTSTEYEQYIVEDKVAPSTIALIRVFMEK